MARVYLQEELSPLLKTCRTMLDNANKILLKTEGDVHVAVKSHETPENVNAIGDEGYKTAGILIAQCMDILQRLGATKASGLRFPRICAIGSPWNFTRALVDSDNFSGTDRSFATAINLHDDTDTTQEPFNILKYRSSWAPGSGEVNLKVKIMKPLTIIAAAHPDGSFDAKGSIMEVNSVGVDGSGKSQLVFENLFCYGTKYTDPAADDGTDTESFELRTVDDGEGDTPDVEELDIKFVEAEVTDDYEVFQSGNITGDIIAIVYTKAESDPFATGVAMGATTLTGDDQVELFADTNVDDSKMWFLERPVAIVSDIVTFTILNGYNTAPNKHGHFAVIYRSRKKSA